MRTEIFGHNSQVIRRAAEIFLQQTQEAVRERAIALVTLSGGSTPKALYQLLVDPEQPFLTGVPWKKIHFFWGDERFVPPDHPDSNYKMAWDAMLSHVPVSPDAIHRFRTELGEPKEVAKAYAAELAEFAQRVQLTGKIRFDLTWLGMGPDGHTASLFPGVPEAPDAQAVSAFWVPQLHSYRLSLLPEVLNESRLIVLLVTGQEKAEATLQAMAPEKGRVSTSRALPVEQIHPRAGDLVWLLDTAAAAKLPNRKVGLNQTEAEKPI
jgi:6-phosphogluconolactonase